LAYLKAMLEQMPAVPDAGMAEARLTAPSGSAPGRAATSGAAPAPIWRAAPGSNGWGNAEREY